MERNDERSKFEKILHLQEQKYFYKKYDISHKEYSKIKFYLDHIELTSNLNNRHFVWKVNSIVNYSSN